MFLDKLNAVSASISANASSGASNPVKNNYYTSLIEPKEVTVGDNGMITSVKKEDDNIPEFTIGQDGYLHRVKDEKTKTIESVLGLEAAPRPTGAEDEEVHTIGGLGEVAATELTDTEKEEALEEFGLADKVDSNWGVYQSINEDGSIGFIFTDKNGNAVQTYIFEDKGAYIHITRQEYTPNKDGGFDVDKTGFRVIGEILNDKWYEEIMQYPTNVVDENGHYKGQKCIPFGK